MMMTHSLLALFTPTRLLVVAAVTLGIAALLNARPAAAAAMLSANPTDVLVPAGQISAPATLSWNTGAPQGGEITVSTDGGAETTVAVNTPPAGNMTVQIGAGHTYVFRLYIGKNAGQPAAAAVTVKGQHPKADLTVTYDGMIGGYLYYTVKNQGSTDAGAFRIAVLAGADSFSEQALPLAAGAARQYKLPYTLIECDRPIALLVDAGHEVDESIENNNGTGFNSPCPVRIPAEPGPIEPGTRH